MMKRICSEDPDGRRRLEIFVICLFPINGAEVVTFGDDLDSNLDIDQVRVPV